MTQLAITARDNKNLFSNYYLDNQLKNNPEWKKDEHKAAFSDIKKLYDAEKDFIPTLNEKQLELRFFGPIFKILNHTIEVNEGTVQGEFPDYAFFPDKASLDDAKKMGKSLYNNAIAIGEVKRWGIELDRFGKDEKDRKRNPSLQIWIYLHDVTPKWGILSNGAKWRLYCKERLRDEYYEVDLPTLIATNDIENFKYFYYFFRRDAFLLSTDGTIFLDEVLKGSADYAKVIGDDLKDNVYKAMKKVAEGFFSWSQNGLDIQNETAHETVQKCTMLLLYRFLFLLYAEGKGLLDLKKPQYQSLSFYKLKNEVKEKQDGPLEQRYLGVRTTLWSNLKDTFRLINHGSESFGINRNVLHVPAYNGGLFDPKKNPELEKWEIGDSYLSEAIDLLSRSRADGGKLDFVDYSTLEIRHLGSIYEGLLEYKLRVAEDEMVVNGGEWVKLEEYNKDRKQKKVFSDFNEFDRVKYGQIYLATDKGERKATGSYYTPDYIVNYIVKNTVGSVVDEKWKDAEANKKSFVEATLSVKVLDPAMGSGHFLVGSIEFLSEKLLLAVKKDIDNGRFSDESHLTSDWARREVVSHCIYGVDLNLMAVELAKVGLWLTTISKEKPLSFLDHRLKQGNSLIGAQLIDLPWYPDLKDKTKKKENTVLQKFEEEVHKPFVDKIVQQLKTLSEIDDDTIEHINQKKALFEKLKENKQYLQIKSIADVYTAVYFGNETTEVNKNPKFAYNDLFWALKGDEKEWSRKTYKPWFKTAMEISRNKSFFHWELEFPELFFEGGAPKENPGWDVVLGNPPYVRQEQLGDDKEYFKLNYEVYNFASDIFAYFYERGVTLSQQDKLMGFISNTFSKTTASLELRGFLNNSAQFISYADFSDLQIFDGATTYPIIPIIKRGFKENNSFKYFRVKSEDLKDLSAMKGAFIVQSNLHDENWAFESETENNLKNKIRNNSKIGKIFGKTFYGVKTALNEAFIIDSKIKNEILNNNPKANIFFKPYLEGKDIDKWAVKNAEKWIILFPKGWTKGIIGANATEEDGWNYIKQNYPKIVEHLEPYKEKAKARYDQGDFWWELRACDYYPLFEHEKIVWPNLQDSNKFSYDNEGFYINAPAVILPTNNKAVLCLLNSKLAWYFFKDICVIRSGGFIEMKPQYFEQFPVEMPISNTPADRRAALVEQAKALYSELLGAPGADNLDRINRIDRINASDPVNPVQTVASLSTALDCRKILEFICARLSAAPEESDVVHDLLAYLAQRMIEMNKEKNAEIKGFLRWFEGEIGAPVEELTNKTAIKEYYEAGFDALAGALAKNKKKLKEGYDPTRREPKEKLLTEFNASVGKLTPLLKRIEATDKLIDQIVYKLYGLTEDEIKIVEKSISGGKDAPETEIAR